MGFLFVNGYAKSNGSGGVSGLSSTAQNHTAGNTIIVFTGNYAGIAVASITDTAGNTYTKKGSTYSQDASAREETWSCDNCIGHASNIVTLTWAGSGVGYTTLRILQYSGLLASGSYDASSTGRLPSSSTTQTTNAVTTTAAGDLVLGAYSAWNTTRTLSGSGGSTLRVQDPASPSDIGVAEITAGAAGNYTVSIGLNSAEQYQCIAYAFKVALAAADGARISDMSKQPMIRGPM